MAWPSGRNGLNRSMDATLARVLSIWQARSLPPPARLRLVVQPDRPIVRRIVGPALAHFDVQEEVHRPLQHLAELVAGAGADLLDLGAALAQHDGALALALDVDDLLDARAAVGPVLPLLGLDRGLVGQLLVELQEDLLARDFG